MRVASGEIGRREVEGGRKGKRRRRRGVDRVGRGREGGL